MQSSPRVNPNIAEARSKATFDPLKLTYFLYGGAERTNRKRLIQNTAISLMKKAGFKNNYELSREEIYDQSLEKSIFLLKKCHELSLNDGEDKFFFTEVLFQAEGSPFTIHNAAFIPTITKLGTKEQIAKWLPLTASCEMLGTYAQTELGHGSFLRGLETTATYDSRSKEFIIDTPTTTSTKFWPGGLGKTANSCVVMAKLLIDGRDCGMQSFLVPLRNMETHRPLPGVSIGDIGTKFGFKGVDNGFLQLNKVRVPRENMLMRYAKVLEDGTFIKPKNDRLVYASMTLLRAFIVAAAAKDLAKAVTIATRYSAVRIQSEIIAGKGEVPVIDFQTQQHKVFVQIATSYAFMMAGKSVTTLYKNVSDEIEKGKFEKMPVLHAISSGLKAFCALNMAHGVEQCRFACGGHGFLQASGLPQIYANGSAACTYEGESTVLILQTARFINKCFEAGKNGFNLPPGLSFLIHKEEKSKLTGELEPEHLVTAFEHRVAVLIEEANTRLSNLKRQGMKPAEAWNNASQALCEAAMAFCHAYIVRVFTEAIQNASFDPSLTRVMMQLCQLYASHGITKNSGHFMKGNFMSAEQLDMVQSKVYDLLADLKPNAVALVDAFDFPDEVLDSALGRYDGNVYEALMESAKNSKLNQKEVHEGIFKYVKPYVKYLKEQKGLQARL